MVDLVDILNSRRSALLSEISRPSSSVTCTVFLSSFSRLPSIVLPSFVTMWTGRLIGHIWLLGSNRDRSSDPALLPEPILERFGAFRLPLSLMRWHERHAPLV